ADLGLPAQARLGPVRHADDVGAPGPVEPRLRAGRELRPLHAHVRSTAAHLQPPAAPRLLEDAGQRRADRIREARVRDDSVAEEGVPPVPGAVDELIRNDGMTRRELLAEAPAGRRGEDGVTAEDLESADVRAVV